MKDKKILFVKICGTGMSSLALMCKECGAEIIGIDEAYYPPVSTILEQNSVAIHKMESLPELLSNGKIDAIVVGNALNGKSDYAQMILDSGIDYYSMPSFLETFLIPDNRSVVVSGTHGKTSTTTMISEFLTIAKYPPSYFVGGIPLFSMKNAHFEEDGFFILEGDEYDTAFFDKNPKFLHYKPHYSIITSIEFDHADIYSSVDQIYNNFKKLTEITSGKIILCLDFELNRKLLSEIYRKKVFTYSMSDKLADLFIEKVGVDNRFTKFNLFINGENKGELLSPFIGDQNLMNLGALLSLIMLENKFTINFDDIFKLLKSLKGVKRRQELIGEINNGLLYSDFAHHPTAVDLTLNGFKDHFPDKKIFVIFDPATNTNNQNIFESEYERIFKNADKIVIGKPPKLDRFEKDEQFSPQRVCDNINSTNEKAFYFENINDTVSWLKNNMDSNSVCVVMSNSGFYGFFEKIENILD